MKPIINLNLTRNEKFSIFQTVLERFIPKNLKDSAVFDLARLLLLYHDPQLCNHLDSLKIGFQHFSLSWFSSLMAEDCEVEVTAQLWDLYLVNQDPWIIFFMVTVMLVNFRDNIIEVVDDREELLARLRRLPSQIEADDIPDLVTLAQVLYEDYPSTVCIPIFRCIQPEHPPLSDQVTNLPSSHNLIPPLRTRSSPSCASL